VSTLVKDRELSDGGHGAGAHPPAHWGGDDRNPGRGGDGSDLPNFHQRLRRYRLGVGVGLASVVMIFVALTSAYVVRQGLGAWDDTTSTYSNDWKPVPLPNAMLLINTLVLLASSVTLEATRHSMHRHAVTAALGHIPGVAVDRESSVPWLGITIVLGGAFLAGQVLAWREMQHAGYFVSGNASSSFFYVLTGAHAVHLAGGLLALLYTAAARLFGRSLDSRRIAIDATSLYWHFMAALWLYVFALLHYVR
jgi:cytochrome c oxidase subunit 3